MKMASCRKWGRSGGEEWGRAPLSSFRERIDELELLTAQFTCQADATNHAAPNCQRTTGNLYSLRGV